MEQEVGQTQSSGDGPQVSQSPPAQKTCPCRQCGASMVFDPSAGAIHCPYCGFDNIIPRGEQDIEELDFSRHIAEQAGREMASWPATVKCPSCGAETTLAANIASDACPFCGEQLVDRAAGAAAGTPQIQPKSLLPFAITREQAAAAFGHWVRKLWFAPTALLRYARAESSRLGGVYVPYWTYDCATTTAYTGQRGEDYWASETYHTMVNGRSVTRTRQVRRTRWYPASGIVFNRFDDILVLASKSLPAKQSQRLEPWDLEGLVPYDERYLAGFCAQSYQVTLEEGFGHAQQRMDGPIRHSIEEDIGGDHQRIDSMRTQYDQITFKHLLLPVWLSAYRYGNATYRFLVNARTGEVQGERPWSAGKIALAVGAAIALIVLIIFIINGYYQQSRRPTWQRTPTPVYHPYGAESTGPRHHVTKRMAAWPVNPSASARRPLPGSWPLHWPAAITTKRPIPRARRRHV